MLRKTVTVLFCDVTGSTALGESIDPEALRGLLGRYFERMKTIVESHGGTVEKFIGDAVMAVFGIPVAHEDDALRAVRAAAEMREALPGLGIEARIGANTGEVVTGTEERLATGDAVNVAARLEQAAQPGEVLIGEATLELVRHAVDVEAVDPLALKGKATPVAAYRLVRVRPAPERSHAARFVGRAGERALMAEAWGRAHDERRCELVTVVGDAGVGKSRLVAEFLRDREATVARGRCLPYGEGITYWPVVEVLKQLDVRPPDDSAAAAIRSLLGETEAVASAEDIAWAFRKTLEHAVAERPLVVVFDDIHWAEETFLDLVEHVALLSAGAPILLIVAGRPELLECRPTWPVTLRLEPLRDEDVAELIPGRIRGDLRDKIARAAGGNPLFIGEMVAMTGEAGGDVVVPPTLQALLTARLDQLEKAERSVLERGAIEGEVFHRGAVQALAPDEPQVTPRLAALVRKDLIRPETSQLEGDDGFRFRHLLIRDAAYDALPKATRAELHERFARWLEEHRPGLVELDEILGYHLEHAFRYRRELGLDGDGLAESARGRLAAAGLRAHDRDDYGAAASLLERAAALAPPGELDLVVEVALVNSLLWGDKATEALRHAGSLSTCAAAAGNEVGALCGRIEHARIRMFLEPQDATEQVAALAREALPVFQAAGNDLALYSAYRALGQAANVRARMDDVVEACERAAEHAERAGLDDRLMGWRQMGRFYGTTPISEFLAWHDEQDPRRLQATGAGARRVRALGMLGRFDEARSSLTRLRMEVADRGQTRRASAYEATLYLELLAGDVTAAVEAGEELCRLREEVGQLSSLSTSAGELARLLCTVDRLEKADAWADRAAELGASDDALTQMLWRQAKATVLARRGEHAEAERLAREAVAIGDATDMIDAQADTYADLGDVLVLASTANQAAAAFDEAHARYKRKGNIVMAERMRTRGLRGGVGSR